MQYHQHGLFQDGEISDESKAPAISNDNVLDLLLTKLTRPVIENKMKYYQYPKCISGENSPSGPHGLLFT